MLVLFTWPLPRTISLRSADEKLVLEASATKQPCSACFGKIPKTSMCSDIMVGVMRFQVGSVPDTGDSVIVCTILNEEQSSGYLPPDADLMRCRHKHMIL